MAKVKRITSRQLQAQKTRSVLFNSAVRLFSRDGYENVLVDDIVAEANTSKGTFYLYFKSKDQVIIELFKKVDHHYIDIVNNMEQFETASEKLLYFVEEQLKYSEAELGLEVIKVMYASQISSDREKFIINEKRPLYKIVREIIEEGQRKGEFRSDILSGELTGMVARCMRAVFYDWCVNDGKFDFVENGCRFFATVVLTGLKV